MASPAVASGGLATVARVARTRYFEQSQDRVRDPVVTCNGDRLRFESFSGCCGVYARLDLLSDARCCRPPPQPPDRLAALVELGVDVVDTCCPAATLPCLEPVVAQRGSSQLVTQTRRLRQALSRSATAT